MLLTCGPQDAIKRGLRRQITPFFVYTAPAPNKQQWRGENPRGDAKDINSIAFKTANIRNRSAITGNAFVACDYEGNSSAGIRMSLETFKVATPVGKAWNRAACGC
ncbi:Transmembrane protein, partial [Pseudomonas savastanoi pv. glycinea]